MVEPGKDDVHDAYESYTVSDDPSVSVGVAPEVGEGNVCRGSSSSGLDVEPLRDRITALAGENVPLKRDVAEKDKRIEELEAKLRAAEDGTASAAAAASRPVAAVSASSTELELLPTRVTSAERAAFVIGQQSDTYGERPSTYGVGASHVFD